MKLLVTGAAGYIGSVVTEQFVARGDTVVALDNLQHGHRAAVDARAEFVRGDLLDGAWLAAYMADHPVDAVVHLAAEALIDESLRDPGRFFRANVTGGLNLLDAMVAAGVRRIIFSSTAAVYGEPAALPIVETHPRVPMNSYGASKLMFETILDWYWRCHRVRSVSLRYFNACGATELHGQYHRPETHIIPILFDVALGERAAINLFGTDYDTPDGTCIRDYIHVSDIARAHVLALQSIESMEARAYNMANGTGYSNRDVIETVRRVTGKEIPVIPAPRRIGDPARLIASSDRIHRELGWEPQYPDLTTMVETAWAWRRRYPRGYEA